MRYEGGGGGVLGGGGMRGHVWSWKAWGAGGFADSVPAGLLHIAQQLGTVVEPQAGIQSEDARAGVLRFRRKAVAALVGRMKGRMPLGNEIGLARDPYAVPLPLEGTH